MRAACPRRIRGRSPQTEEREFPPGLKKEDQDMKRYRTATIAAVALLAGMALVAAGCGTGGSNEFRDPAVPIVVEKGQEFTIVLESNPTTGYQWQLFEPLDEDVVSLVKTEFEEGDTERVGAPGEERWTFKAEGLGETDISFVYVRPWESEAEPLAAEGEEEESGEGGEESAAEEQEEAPAATEESSGEAAESEELVRPVTFHVEVRKKGSLEGEPEAYEDAGTPIEVEKGERFSVVLESNPAKGYSWKLAEPLDGDLLLLEKVEFEKKGSHGEEGDGFAPAGKETWTFEAVGVGGTELRFRLYDMEEGTELEEADFEVEIVPMEEGEESH
jgi:inhibitor of cysteine peptidase